MCRPPWVWPAGGSPAATMSLWSRTGCRRLVSGSSEQDSGNWALRDEAWVAPSDGGPPLALVSHSTTPMPGGQEGLQRMLDAVSGADVEAVVTLGAHIDPPFPACRPKSGWSDGSIIEPCSNTRQPGARDSRRPVGVESRRSALEARPVPCGGGTTGGTPTSVAPDGDGSGLGQ